MHFMSLQPGIFQGAFTFFYILGTNKEVSDYLVWVNSLKDWIVNRKYFVLRGNEYLPFLAVY